MNKIKENSALIKKILFIVLAGVLFITSLTLFIQSIESYDGGFDANKDYVVCMIISLIILAYAIYLLISKNQNSTLGRQITIGTSCAIACAYSLGVFFKGIAKGKEYAGIQIYLYAGIVTLLVLFIVGLDYLESKKSN